MAKVVNGHPIPTIRFGNPEQVEKAGRSLDQQAIGNNCLQTDHHTEGPPHTSASSEVSSADVAAGTRVRPPRPCPLQEYIDKIELDDLPELQGHHDALSTSWEKFLVRSFFGTSIVEATK